MQSVCIEKEKVPVVYLIFQERLFFFWKGKVFDKNKSAMQLLYPAKHYEHSSGWLLETHVKILLFLAFLTHVMTSNKSKRTLFFILVSLYNKGNNFQAKTNTEVLLLFDGYFLNRQELVEKHIIVLDVKIVSDLAVLLYKCLQKVECRLYFTIALV